MARLDKTLYERFRPDTSNYPAIARFTVKSEVRWQRAGDSYHWLAWRFKDAIPLGSELVIEKPITYEALPVVKNRTISYLPSRFLARVCGTTDETKYLGLSDAGKLDNGLPAAMVLRAFLPVLAVEETGEFTMPRQDSYEKIT